MTNSIFPSLSMDREVIRWEDHLADLTPFENHNGVWFKREDKFAPLGYGGPNGSKMRQLVWLMNRNRAGKTHVLTGASVMSPQISMSTIVGAHYGLPTRVIVGATKPETIFNHPNPAIAKMFGAKFEFMPVGYNPYLQKQVAELARPDSLVVEYGITLQHDAHPAVDVHKFHLLGGYQVTNLPPEVETLIVPAGSCNSLTSVLVGLNKDSGNLKKLFTLGIGPDKTKWVKERMDYMGETTEFDFEWEHYSLHDNKYAAYSDSFKGETFDGIDFHPTYEAKMIRWLNEFRPMPQDDTTAFWIVGSAPKLNVIEQFAPVN